MKNNSSHKYQQLLLGLAYFSPFVFPLYFFRFEAYGIPLTALELFSYFFFSVFLLSVILGVRKISWEKPARWYYLAAFVLLIGATLGVITAPHYIARPSGELMDSQMAALGVWKGWILAPMLYFFTFTQVIDNVDKLKKLLLYFVYSGALVGLASYVFAMFGNGVTYDFRLSGFFESANYLSLYLGPPLLLGVYYMLNGKMQTRRQELYNIASVTIMTHALFMTQSYAAIIAVFGALGLYIVVLLVKHKVGLFKLSMAFLALILTFAAILFSQRDSTKFRQFTDFENRSSSTVRLEIYEISYGL